MFEIDKSNLYGNLKRKIRTTLRYRLLFLISIPIFITMLMLIIGSLYWSVNYTWRNALNDVSEKLKIVDHNVTILQERQHSALGSFGDSYRFQKQIYNPELTSLEINQWIKKEGPLNHFDFINWVPVTEIETIDYCASCRGFFDVFTEDELLALSPALATKARILIKKNNTFQTSGLVSRTVYSVQAESGDILGYLNAGILLNNSHSIVDEFRNLIYPNMAQDSSENGTVTIFLHDLRVSTNVLSSNNGGRALGTTVSNVVRDTVLVKGENFIDNAYVLDDWYISAYKPIYNYNGNIIGILYTGYGIWPFVEQYIIYLVEIVLGILLVLILSGVYVYKNTRDLFYPIERISSAVKSIRNGKSTRIGKLNLDHEHELTKLSVQFDKMLDLLDEKKKRRQVAAQELEYQVLSRTTSLNQKTEELENYIKLLHETRDKLIDNEKLASLGKLTAGIAHEINNPITVILGNVELLKMELEGTDPLIEDELDNILSQINRIIGITSSLLQYSRIGSEYDSLSKEDVTEVVKEAITLVRTGSHTRNINFITHYSNSGVIECNRNKLLQVLVNIMINAVQAMNGKGFLSIFTEDWLEDSEVIGSIVHIQDKGCGIRADDLAHIFEPFFTTKPDGTGLGLALSHSLITQIGGSVKVKSQLGLGSTFSLYLKKEASITIEELHHK